ncbi:MAG TPA: hypothetical protein VML96_08360 [Egibacteraceae bacterium]|nr:hypothetical protein [Egibacteraceae bacterium]
MSPGRGGGLVAGVLPAPLRDPAQRRGLLGWLGVGLAVRLLLMPFSVSADLLAIYWRSHLIAYDGQLFGSYLVNMGAHYVHAASLRLLAPLLPAPDEVWTDPWWWADSSALAPQVQRAFSESPGAYQTLFALKLPYLAADLAAGLLLLALVGACRPALVRRAWAFWMLSPIGLYATYVFGRYEALAVVFVVGALWACERERPWLGALLLGVGITMRGYPLLLVPVFALIVFRRPLRQAAWAAVALAPFAAIMASNRMLAGTVGELATLRDFHTGTTFFAYTLPVEGDGQVYVFFLFALTVYGALAGRAWGWWSRPGEISQLWLWLLVFHAGMFALATFSAHYFMWITPFVALALARREQWRGVLPLHLLQAGAVLAIADLLGGPGTLLGLFEPLEPDLVAAAPSLREALLGSPGLVVQGLGLLRTGFFAAMLLLVWPAVRELAVGELRGGDLRAGLGARDTPVGDVAPRRAAAAGAQAPHAEPERADDQREPHSRESRLFR